MRITGKVVSGLGEGKIFLSMEHYKDEIEKKLGFEVFPGTLNIKTQQSFVGKDLAPIKIEGCARNNRKFGGATCYRARIRNIECAIIVPDITRHDKSIVEIIAQDHLRTELSLKDNDKITVEAT